MEVEVEVLTDLYVFNDQMVQVYRGVNINIRDNEESLGEMHMKDYIDVSNQENTAPVYFQFQSLSLSLDDYLVLRGRGCSCRCRCR